MNVFKEFFNNWLFLFITIFTIVIQIVLVEYSDRATKSYPMTVEQTIICIVVGLTSLVWGIIVKILPAGCFCCKLDDSIQDIDNESRVSEIRSSRITSKTNIAREHESKVKNQMDQALLELFKSARRAETSNE